MACTHALAIASDAHSSWTASGNKLPMFCPYKFILHPEPSSFLIVYFSQLLDMLWTPHGGTFMREYPAAHDVEDGDAGWSFGEAASAPSLCKTLLPTSHIALTTFTPNAAYCLLLSTPPVSLNSFLSPPPIQRRSLHAQDISSTKFSSSSTYSFSTHAP